MPASADPIRLVFLGSGAFGLPTLEALRGDRRNFEIALVVSQPDKPAGRQRRLTPTPVADWGLQHALPVITPADVNEPATVERIRALAPDALVVIAFGQKIGPALLEDCFAINLHGSLLPAYRGAAPIQRAMMDGCTTTGVSVITLAQRMDAGDILATAATPIDPGETAGELHDRLAHRGPEVVQQVLRAFRAGALRAQPQDESAATRAPKLTKAEGVTDFNDAAPRVRARIHGLNPWPGCTVQLDDAIVRLTRVRDRADEPHDAAPGTILETHHVACASGAIEIIEIQPEGGRAMSLSAYCNGRAFEPGMRLTPRSAET